MARSLDPPLQSRIPEPPIREAPIMMTVPGRHEEASYFVCTYQSAHKGHPPVTVGVKTGCRVRCRMNVRPIWRNDHTKDVPVVRVECDWK